MSSGDGLRSIDGPGAGDGWSIVIEKEEGQVPGGEEGVGGGDGVFNKEKGKTVTT